MTDHRIQGVLHSRGEIAERVRQLGEMIASDRADAEEVHVVGVLKGAFVFMADLGRAIAESGGPPIRYHFVKASAYGGSVKANGETDRQVSVELIPQGIRGKKVIVVEDILDQGFTLRRLCDVLVAEQGAASIDLCVLLVKQLESPTPEVAANRSDLEVRYSGFEIPDRWVAGYGLDVNEEFRELPDVVVVKEEVFV